MKKRNRMVIGLGAIILLLVPVLCWGQTPVTTAIGQRPRHGVITVGTTPVRITQKNDARHSLVIENQGTVDAYCGFSPGITASVSATPRIAVNVTLTLDRTTAELWCVTASSSTYIGFLEE